MSFLQRALVLQTPQSRAQKTDRIAQECKRRVGAADVHHGHCNVASSPPEGTLDACHLLPQREKDNAKLVRFNTGTASLHVVRRLILFVCLKLLSLEYHWNMRRQTLNVDTRYNILFRQFLINLLYPLLNWFYSARLQSESICIVCLIKVHGRSCLRIISSICTTTHSTVRLQDAQLSAPIFLTLLQPVEPRYLWFTFTTKFDTNEMDIGW